MNASRPSKLKIFLEGDDLEQGEILAPIAEPSISSPASSESSDEFASLVHPIFEEPTTIEDTQMPQSFLADLALKTLYYGGTMPGGQVAHAMCLHFNGVVEPILRALKSQHLVEVVGGNSLNQASYQ
jgi:hypothetical protein